MSAFTNEVVQSVYHWTDTLFSFRTSRNPTLRFECGQFVMIGIEHEGRPLTRAYSIVSSNYDDYLEFLSIKVPHGALTSRLQHINKDDVILVSKKPTGTLVIDHLRPGSTLYLLATGTGLAPFMSIIRDPATYDRFERIALVHGCRNVAELAYAETITSELPNDEFIGELVREKLIYYPTVTREPFRNQGRITDLIKSGQLFANISQPPLSSKLDRIMLCGSPEMNVEIRSLLLEQGLREGNAGEPGEFVIEKAFVEK